MNKKLDVCHQMSTIRDFITYYVFTYKVRSVYLSHHGQIDLNKVLGTAKGTHQTS